MQDRQPARDVTFPRLLGGRLCLDFVNTIDTPLDTPQDFLIDYDALVRWGHHRSLVDREAMEHLLATGTRNTMEAAVVFAAALALRTALQEIFTAIAARSEPPPLALTVVHDRYVAGLAQMRLMPAGNKFAWDSTDNSAQSRILWPIAQSAVELLTSGDLARVKQCSGPDGCGWLFYDASKNGSRRWCSMEGCGAHAKMRRYHARRRLARSAREQ